MTAVANPFDILPANLFNLFSTQGQGDWQRHYMAVLLRIYELAEFNRFGLTREQVIAEIVDYLNRQDIASFQMLDDFDGSRSNEPQEIASWIVRRLAEPGRNRTPSSAAGRPLAPQPIRPSRHKPCCS